jgi:hypothetical protein
MMSSAQEITTLGRHDWQALHIGPLDRHALLMLIGVPAIWWGIWAFLAWALSSFPAL